MSGYKIEIDCDSQKFYLSNDNISIDVDGYTWKEKRKAENVIKSIKKTKNFTYYQKQHMHVISISEEKTQEKIQMDTKLNNIPNSTSCLILDDNNKNELFNAVTELACKLRDYTNLNKTVNDNINREDLITLDLLHYIELTNENDPRQIKYLNLLRESRIRRRRAKDIQKVLDTLKPAISSIAFAEQWITGANDRVYKPRAIEPLPNNNEDRDGNINPVNEIMKLNDVQDSIAYPNNVETNNFEDCIVQFSKEFTEQYKATHKPRKNGNWCILGYQNKVIDVVRMVEKYKIAISNNKSSDKAISELSPDDMYKKRYTQIAKGRGYYGRIAKEWEKYKNSSMIYN